MRISGRVICILWLGLFDVQAATKDAAVYEFNIPSQPLVESLNALSNQTESLILFPYYLVDKRNANAVSGRFTIAQALDEMLMNTGLVGGRSKKGVLMISPAETETANNQNEEYSVKNKKNLWAMLIAFIVSGTGTEAALSQQEGKPVYGMEEIVVQAQKRDQSSQDISVSVDAFSSDALENMGIDSTTDLSSISPGVVISNLNGGSTPTISIRGVGVGGASYFANQPNSAAINVNGVYLPSAIMSNFQIFDLEQVEVLKGPQGTLFGRNTSAGAVNFYTRKPSEEVEGYVSLSYARYNTINVEAATGGPLSDSVNYRVAAVSATSDGFSENVFGGVTRDANGTDRFAVRGQLQFLPSDATEVLLSLHGGADKSDIYQQQQQPAQPDGTTSGPFSYDEEPCLSAYTTADVGCLSGSQSLAQNVSAYDGDNFQFSSNLVGEDAPLGEGTDLDAIGSSITVEHDFDSFTLTSITAYDNFTRLYSEDADGGPTTELHIFFDEDFTSYSQELRLTSTTDSKFQWIAGFYGSILDATMKRHADFEDLIPFAITYENKIDETAYALFSHNTYDFTDDLTFILGLRYSYEEKEINVLNANVAPGPENLFSFDTVTVYRVPPGYPTQKDDWDNVSGKIGLDYRINDDVLVYGHFSRGFKSGGFPGSIGIRPAQFVQYDPEIVDAFEIGTKTNFADGAGLFNLAFFTYDYQDKQVTGALPGDGTTFGFTNAAEATISGLELQLGYSFDFDARLEFGMAYVDSEYDEFAAPFGDASGNTLPYAPEVTANLQYSQRLELSGSKALELASNVAFTDEQFLDSRSAPIFSAESYALWNARANLEFLDSGITASVFVKNITDEEYRVAGTNHATGTFSFTYGSPRAAGIELRKSW